MAYGFYRSVTIDHTQCGSVAPGATFAVLVKITGATSVKTIANGGRINTTGTQVGGVGGTIPYDLVFSSDTAGASKYAWEVEYYDGTAGDLIVWVTGPVVPASSGADVIFYMVYGDASVVTQQNTGSFAPSAVWDANYIGVYHLPNGTANLVSDSTASGLGNGTNHSVTGTTGKIDGGGAFVSASSRYIGIGGTGVNLTNITAQAWINGSSFPASGKEVLTKGYNGSSTAWELDVGANGAGKVEWTSYNGTKHGITASVATLSTGNWYHLAGSYDVATTTWRLYINGAQDSSSVDVIGPIANIRTMNIGAVDVNPGIVSFFDGTIDEVRVSNIARPAEWILTEYNNQNAPGNIGSAGFLTFGAETSPGSFSPGWARGSNQILGGGYV